MCASFKAHDFTIAMCDEQIIPSFGQRGFIWDQIQSEDAFEDNTYTVLSMTMSHYCSLVIYWCNQLKIIINFLSKMHYKWRPACCELSCFVVGLLVHLSSFLFCYCVQNFQVQIMANQERDEHTKVCFSPWWTLWNHECYTYLCSWWLLCCLVHWLKHAGFTLISSRWLWIFKYSHSLDCGCSHHPWVTWTQNGSYPPDCKIECNRLHNGYFKAYLCLGERWAVILVASDIHRQNNSCPIWFNADSCMLHTIYI